MKSLTTALILFVTSPYTWAAAPAVDGLVYLQHGGSFCSGSLFAPKDYDKTQKALVLTNGHCTGMGSSNVFGGTYLSPTERINYVEATNMTLYILKKGLEDVNANLLSLNDQYDAQLMVATMYKKDIAIYQINATYKELEQKGYHPLILATKAPKLTTQVTYHSSAWGTQVTCTLEAYADMVIEGFWVWNNVMRMMGEGCYAQGGASGSPVLDEAGNLVAALNTMYEGGQKCSIMNPCERERDSGTSTVFDGSVYAITVVSLNACFDQNKKLDLSLCNLH